MKKLIGILSITLLIILMSTLSMAAPFLVCDPQAGVQSYEIFIDGQQVTGGPILAEVDGSLQYDLAGTTPGAYTFTAKACADPWGCSEDSDPFVSPPPVLKPTGLRLAK